MSTLFNLWSLYLTTSTSLTFDVTTADAFLVSTGSREWVRECLRAMAVAAKADTWTIQCIRQSYYSDYLHSADWQARWDIAWIVTVTLSSPAELTNVLQPLPFKATVPDETAGEEEEPVLPFGPGLVMASFPIEAKMKAQVGDSVQSWRAEERVAGAVRLEWRPHLPGRILARIFIDSIKFPQDIAKLHGLEGRLQQFGGTTNWRELLSL